MIVNLKKFMLIIICIVLCISTIFICSAVETTEITVKLPILMYHHLSEKQSKLNKYTVSVEEFENDLKYIQENGYTTVGLQDIINFVSGGKLPEKPIMITFDDGYLSVYKYAFPKLCERNMKAVVNVIGKYTQMYSNISDHNVNYAHITFEQLKEMNGSGLIEIGNHTYDLHKTTDRLGIQRKSGESLDDYKSVIISDLTEAQNLIKDNVGITPIAFAYPFGKIPKDALPILKELGFVAVFSCYEKANILTGDPEQLYHLNRVNRPHGKSAEKILTAL